MAKIYSYRCKQCGKPFNSSTRGRVFCSRQCNGLHMRGKKKLNYGKKKPTKYVCKECGKSFERMKNPSKPNPQFCSPTCRNKARKLELIPCPVCGTPFSPGVVDIEGNRRKSCSRECSYLLHVGEISPRRTPKNTINEIAKLYKEIPAHKVAKQMGMTTSQVRNIINNFVGPLPPEVAKRRSARGARKFLTENNPMHNPKSKAKIKRFYEKHPEAAKERSERIVKARQKQQRDKPTKLELEMFSYLDDLGVEYKSYIIIKPKFVVDCQIGNLILEADGDYWHGHPRFEPLTKRQLGQQKRDRARDKYLTTCGYAVERIWESDMSLETIKGILQNHNLI